MPIHTPNNPMICTRCNIPNSKRGVSSDRGTQNIPFYTCPKCGHTQMSSIVKYAYMKADDRAVTHIGLEAACWQYLKEDVN